MNAFLRPVWLQPLRSTGKLLADMQRCGPLLARPETPLDALGLRFDVFGLLRDMGEHMLGQRLQFNRV